MTRIAFDAVRRGGTDLSKYTQKEYTPKGLVIDCLARIPLGENDFVLDCAAGSNMVWFNCIKQKRKDYCELDEGKDFFKYKKKADWVVGNPPFRHFIDFCYKSCEVSVKGFAFLINHARLNQLTPKRLNDFASKGFYLNGIFIVGVKKWFGRYYFVVFGNKPENNIGWNNRVYAD